MTRSHSERLARAQRRGRWRIFEGFLRRFLDREQGRYDVAAPALQWHGAKGTPRDMARLPGMQTDIVLEAPHRLERSSLHPHQAGALFDLPVRPGRDLAGGPVVVRDSRRNCN